MFLCNYPQIVSRVKFLGRQIFTNQAGRCIDILIVCKVFYKGQDARFDISVISVMMRPIQPPAHECGPMSVDVDPSS